MRKGLTFIVVLTLLFSLNGCLVDVKDDVKNILIDARGLEILTKDVNFSKYPVLKDTTNFPITAWFGIPNGHLNLSRFQELKDAGININYFRYSNVDSVKKALDLSQQVGIKTLINCPELVNNTKATVRLFMDHPANAGYFIRDEPPVSMIPSLSNFINTIRSVDNSRFCYVNLLPLYATSVGMGTDSYLDYVKRYSDELPLEFISFDFYPIVGNLIQYGWYKNLEIIRNESIRTGKPFWAFGLTTSHNEYPIPTLDHLRLQVFSNLAYGAKGIQYYTYWTTTSPNFLYTSGPIEKDGKKTAVYDYLKTVNTEINRLAYIFLSTKVTDVSHYGNLPDGTKSFTKRPFFVTSLNIEGESAIISEMKNDTVSYIMIQNNSLNNPIAIDIKTDSQTKLILKNGSIIPASLITEKFKLTPGDAVFFMRK